MTTEATEPKRGYRGYVLAILIVVYTFNFLDRQILGILAGPIKAELGLMLAPLKGMVEQEIRRKLDEHFS